jgi:Rrf2 family protein
MMMVFARHGNGSQVVSLNQASKEARVSRRYLEQLAISLKNGALIRGKSGKGGGYALARPADHIKIRQIVESAVGPINIVDCVGQPDMCMKSNLCECRILYRLINKQITTVLDSFVLADLVDGKRLRDVLMSIDPDYSAGGFPAEDESSGDPVTQ